jgi:hypothetical protein
MCGVVRLRTKSSSIIRSILKYGVKFIKDKTALYVSKTYESEKTCWIFGNAYIMQNHKA